MVDRGIARDGYKVLDDGGREIGYVTSGSPAPFLKRILRSPMFRRDRLRWELP